MQSQVRESPQYPSLKRYNEELSPAPASIYNEHALVSRRVLLLPAPIEGRSGVAPDRVKARDGGAYGPTLSYAKGRSVPCVGKLLQKTIDFSPSVTGLTSFHTTCRCT